MTDVHNKQTRSRNMAAIKGTNTKPELLIRHKLHARGFRYKLHDKNLPGKPDLVFPKHHAVVLIHGCFWHGHDCPLFKMPATRTEFWSKKISDNVRRDDANRSSLASEGWRFAEVWECALKGRSRFDLETVIDTLADWLDNEREYLNIRGRGDDDS